MDLCIYCENSVQIVSSLWVDKWHTLGVNVSAWIDVVKYSSAIYYRVDWSHDLSLAHWHYQLQDHIAPVDMFLYACYVGGFVADNLR